MALTTAAGAGTVVATDPMPFAPSGWVGEGVATVPVCLLTVQVV
jgi:hypothetical protein